MNREILTSVLEKLESIYPEPINATELSKGVDTSVDKEFLQVINYLNETQKIHVNYGDRNKRDRTNDKLRILPKGIDYLNEIRLIDSRERSNTLMTIATIAIALFGLFQLIHTLYGTQTTIDSIQKFSNIVFVVIVFLAAIAVIEFIVKKINLLRKRLN